MELTPIAQGVLAWLSERPGPGRANAGVVVDGDGLTLIDTLMVASQWEPLAEAIDGLGLPLRRVVLTSSHIPFVGGSPRFWQAAFYGTPATSEALDLPPNVDGYRRLYPDHADELDDELTTRPVSHVVDEPAALTAAVHLQPLPGPSVANLVALVPGAGVCFAGALCSFGVTPLGFEADFEAWAASLEVIAGAASVVVPGVGPVGGPPQCRELAGYLRACLDARGDADRLEPGPWDAWSERQADAVNVERAASRARGEDRIPVAMLRLVGLA